MRGLRVPAPIACRASTSLNNPHRLQLSWFKQPFQIEENSEDEQGDDILTGLSL
jgi:hypothetical protein